MEDNCSLDGTVVNPPSSHQGLLCMSQALPGIGLSSNSNGPAKQHYRDCLHLLPCPIISSPFDCHIIGPIPNNIVFALSLAQVDHGWLLDHFCQHSCWVTQKG